MMSVNNLRNFISKFENTDKLDEAYLDFQFSWLDGFNENAKRQVQVEWDCMRNEHFFGDGDYEKEILRDFIKSLENMLNRMN